MNAADKAIEEIRGVRHRISAECGHDINRYFAYLREMEKQFPEQVGRGREIVKRRKAKEQGYRAKTHEDMALREKPKH